MSGIDTPSAVITARVRLAWRTARDTEVAGIPFPRAGSGLALLVQEGHSLLAMVQDDAASIAFVDPLTGLAGAVRVRDVDGLRFDPPFGEKKRKLDLECCVVIPRHYLRVGPDRQEMLVAFGSGSTELRERIALFDPATLSSGVVPAHGLYAALRDVPGFAAGALNIEGAVIVDDRLWLFQRGNGGAFPALASVAIDAFWRHLDGGPAPIVADVRRVDLGTIDGVPLGFTDAARFDGRTWWLGSAESSPNTYDDGLVAGSAIGILDGPRATLRMADAVPFSGKAEGLALVSNERAWIAVDPDDPNFAAELLDVALAGF